MQCQGAGKTMDMLLANPAQLKSVLMFHVVPGKTMAADRKTVMSKRSKAPTCLCPKPEHS
jgi:uncharacterized surface protein with fasciclin (FAS1) repeats